MIHLQRGVGFGGGEWTVTVKTNVGISTPAHPPLLPRLDDAVEAVTLAEWAGFGICRFPLTITIETNYCSTLHHALHQIAIAATTTTRIQHANSRSGSYSVSTEELPPEIPPGESISE